MWHIVQDSKYEAETISIILSFADVIPAGQTISGTPVITVSLFTGQDSNPSNLLYEGVTIYSGTSVEQRVRLGIPGNIYYLLYQIVTTGGQNFEKDCYLAILPDEDSAVPTYQEIFEPTQLYPYHAGPDYVQSGIQWLAARLNNVFYAIPAESIKDSFVWTGGSLITTGIIYHNPYEDFKATIVWTGGNLINTGLTYNNPHEDVKSAFAWISGTLVNSGLSYHNPHEDMKATISWTGGTLT